MTNADELRARLLGSLEIMGGAEYAFRNDRPHIALSRLKPVLHEYQQRSNPRFESPGTLFLEYLPLNTMELERMIAQEQASTLDMVVERYQSQPKIIQILKEKSYLRECRAVEESIRAKTDRKRKELEHLRQFIPFPYLLRGHGYRLNGSSETKQTKTSWMTLGDQDSSEQVTEEIVFELNSAKEFLASLFAPAKCKVTINNPRGRADNLCSAMSYIYFKDYRWPFAEAKESVQT